MRMKRIRMLASFLALVMVLSAACPGLTALPVHAGVYEAGVTITEREGVELNSGVEWIKSANLLKVFFLGNYVLMDTDGKRLSDDKYYTLSAEFGYILGAIENPEKEYGLLSDKGYEMIPFEYDDLWVCNSHWAVGFELTETSDKEDYDWDDMDGNLYVRSSTDVYYLDDDQAALVASLERDEISRFKAYGECIVIENRKTGEIKAYNRNFEVVQDNLDSVFYNPDMENTGLISKIYTNGRYGLLDSEGKELLPPIYNNISIDDGMDYIKITSDSGEGLADWEGNIVIPAEYDSILETNYGTVMGHQDSAKKYAGNGYVTAVHDGKYVFLDVNGNIAAETEVSPDNIESRGECAASVLYEDEDGAYHILAADGEETVFDASYFLGIHPLEHSSGMFYLVTGMGTLRYGLVDWHGRMLLDTVYDRIELSADGTKLLVCKRKAGGNIYDVEYEGPIHIPAEKEKIQSSSGKKNTDDEKTPELSGDLLGMLEEARDLALKDIDANYEQIKELIINAETAASSIDEENGTSICLNLIFIEAAMAAGSDGEQIAEALDGLIADLK